MEASAVGVNGDFDIGKVASGKGTPMNDMNGTMGYLALVGQQKLDAALLRYDAWWLVLFAILLAVGGTLLMGMAVWCVTRGHGWFTGQWHFSWSGASIDVRCRS